MKRIHFCYTPKHGSWLNVAECELSCLTSRCLSHRRIGKVNELQQEIGVWSDKTNAIQRGIDEFESLNEMCRLPDREPARFV